LCPFATGQREYERERVVAGLGWSLGRLGKERRKKEEKRRRMANSSKICLNFKKAKI
jgi:hypothetical protein